MPIAEVAELPVEDRRDLARVLVEQEVPVAVVAVHDRDPVDRRAVVPQPLAGQHDRRVRLEGVLLPHPVPHPEPPVDPLRRAGRRHPEGVQGDGRRVQGVQRGQVGDELGGELGPQLRPVGRAEPGRLALALCRRGDTTGEAADHRGLAQLGAVLGHPVGARHGQDAVEGPQELELANAVRLHDGGGRVHPQHHSVAARLAVLRPLEVEAELLLRRAARQPGEAADGEGAVQPVGEEGVEALADVLHAAGGVHVVPPASQLRAEDLIDGRFDGVAPTQLLDAPLHALRSTRDRVFRDDHGRKLTPAISGTTE